MADHDDHISPGGGRAQVGYDAADRVGARVWRHESLNGEAPRFPLPCQLEDDVLASDANDGTNREINCL